MIALGTLLITACNHSPVAPDRTPAWLTSLITQFETKQPTNPPAFIAKYEFQGAIVYYVPPSCCDMWSTVYSTDGSVVCHPDGGFTGKGDGLCPTFLGERKNEQIVWRDTRSGS